MMGALLVETLQGLLFKLGSNFNRWPTPPALGNPLVTYR